MDQAKFEHRINVVLFSCKKTPVTKVHGSVTVNLVGEELCIVVVYNNCEKW